MHRARAQQRLTAAILTGLVLNAAAGWWWAHPATGLVIVAYALKEGSDALDEARAPRPAKA